MKYYVICFIARTGSTYYRDLIEKTNLAGKPTEIFNHAFLEPLSKQHNNFPLDISLPDFIEIMRKERSKNNVFGFGIRRTEINKLKSDMSHYDARFEELSHYQVLNELFPDIQFIYVLRQDILAQAISTVKSQQIGIWHLRRDKLANMTQPTELPFDFASIETTINFIMQQRKWWDEFFETNQINPLTVYYNDLMSRPESVVKKTFEYLDIELGDDYTLPTSTFVKQGNEINESWYNQYIDTIGVEGYAKQVGTKVVSDSLRRHIDLLADKYPALDINTLRLLELHLEQRFQNE